MHEHRLVQTPLKGILTGCALWWSKDEYVIADGFHKLFITLFYNQIIFTVRIRGHDDINLIAMASERLRIYKRVYWQLPPDTLCKLLMSTMAMLDSSSDRASMADASGAIHSHWYLTGTRSLRYAGSGSPQQRGRTTDETFSWLSDASLHDIRGNKT